MATETPTGLTKIDIAALKQADSIEINYPASPSQPAFVASKRQEKTEASPFAADYVYHTIASATSFFAPEGYSDDVSNARGHEVLSIYRDAPNHVASILAILKVGDFVTFQFAADYGSTTALKEVGFHADMLYMRVRRGDKVIARFTLETRITNGRWRMVSGIVPKPAEVPTEAVLRGPY